MARPLRPVFPGAVYHLTVRGNARGKIFFVDDDRTLFLKILSVVISRYGWICHAYCLMPNHYHLLVETPKPNLSIGMRQLNGVYTQDFNRRHNRVGHLFQGRYKAILVEKQSHLLELCRYVVLNPFRIKGKNSGGDWKWTSYEATAGMVSVPAFLSVDWVLAQFGETQRKAQAAYRQFVKEGVESRPWEELIGQIYLGSERFIEEHSRKARPDPEIPRRQLNPSRPSLREIFAKRGNKAIRDAYVRHGYTMKQIAGHLNVHYATVSRRLKKLEETRSV
jgi:putative transposase